MNNINIHKLELDTPKDIINYSRKQVIDLLGVNSNGNDNYNSMQIGLILDKLLTEIGIVMDNQQFMFLMCDAKRLLCEAGAGTGKTTLFLLKVIKEKVFFGKRGCDILAIAYNDSAVNDMQRRMRSLTKSLNNTGYFDIDDTLICRTFHSNAMVWVKKYRNYCNIKREDKDIILREADEFALVKKALTKAIEKAGLTDKVEPTDIIVSKLIKFNSYREEKMIKLDEFNEHSLFFEIGLESDLVMKIFTMFNKMCSVYDKYTFSHILTMYYELLRDHEDARLNIAKAYPILGVDEYQDMTPLMNACIDLMLIEESTFIAIGDGDQAVYGFRGTDSLNCLKFRDYFKDGMVLSMGVNRRCKKAIVDVARNILNTNTLRYDKEIYSVKDGGEVVSNYYKSQSSQYRDIIKQLKLKDEMTFQEICIAYRNKESSALLTRMLVEENIPFRVGSGYTPYGDALSKNLLDIFQLLETPTNQSLQKDVLFKLLPSTRLILDQVITNSKPNTKFGDLNYGDLINKPNFLNALETLKRIYESYQNNENLNVYFGKLYKIFELYYWNNQRYTRNFPRELEELIVTEYSGSYSYYTLEDKIKENMLRSADYIKRGFGVYLSTFHKLKGSEFDELFIIDLAENIFPNFSKVEEEGFTELQELQLKEESVRLFYVAVTRARNKLTMYFDKDNPSQFIDLVRPRESLEEIKLREVKKVEIEKPLINNDFDLTSGIIDSDDFVLPEINLEDNVIIPERVIEIDLTEGLLSENELKIEDEGLTIDFDLTNTEEINDDVLKLNDEVAIETEDKITIPKIKDSDLKSKIGVLKMLGGRI